MGITSGQRYTADIHCLVQVWLYNLSQDLFSFDLSDITLIWDRHWTWNHMTTSHTGYTTFQLISFKPRAFLWEEEACHTQSRGLFFYCFDPWQLVKFRKTWVNCAYATGGIPTNSKHAQQIPHRVPSYVYPKKLWRTSDQVLVPLLCNRTCTASNAERSRLFQDLGCKQNNSKASSFLWARDCECIN